VSLTIESMEKILTSMAGNDFMFRFRFLMKSYEGAPRQYYSKILKMSMFFSFKIVSRLFEEILIL